MDLIILTLFRTCSRSFKQIS